MIFHTVSSWGKCIAVSYSSLLNFSFSLFPRASAKLHFFNGLFFFFYLICSFAEAEGDLKAAIGKRKWNVTWWCPHRTQSAKSGQVIEDPCAQSNVCESFAWVTVAAYCSSQPLKLPWSRYVPSSFFLQGRVLYVHFSARSVLHIPSSLLSKEIFKWKYFDLFHGDLGIFPFWGAHLIEDNKTSLNTF